MRQNNRIYNIKNNLYGHRVVSISGHILTYCDINLEKPRIPA